jgi:hypothetical protein
VSVEVSSAIEATTPLESATSEGAGGVTTDMALMIMVCIMAVLGLAGMLTMAG